MTETQVRVLIADDQALLRGSLRVLMDLLRLVMCELSSASS
ncbi:MAG: hypothetical protein ACRDTA_27615 [Pseudonocardiaceae bacterium]